MKNRFSGLIFVAVGIGIAWWGKGILNEAKATKNWPSVQGTVVESRVVSFIDTSGSGSKKRRTRMFKPQITYQYTVNGKKLTGDKVSPTGEYGSSRASEAKKVVKKYPVGASVKVYYDPELPQDSVLEPGTTLISYVPFGMGLVFAVIGGLIFLGGIFRPIKKIFRVYMS